MKMPLGLLDEMDAVLKEEQKARERAKRAQARRGKRR